MTTSVLEGRGVGFLKQGRVKKLMEDENYRNFVVSRLNTALEKKLTDENQHLEDVVRVLEDMMWVLEDVVMVLEDMMWVLKDVVMVLEDMIRTWYWYWFLKT